MAGGIGDCGLMPVDTSEFYKKLSEPQTALQQRPATNLMPEGQGKRDCRRPRHDLIPLEFLDELAEIFEEGRKPRPGLPDGYGDSWKRGGREFLLDCLNHASNHLHKYMNGDYSENQLAKVAWNVLAVRWHDLREKRKGLADGDDAQ